MYSIGDPVKQALANVLFLLTMFLELRFFRNLLIISYFTNLGVLLI